MLNKARLLTRPTPARRDAPFRWQGCSEVRDAKNNERHVCGRARVGERPVSWARRILFQPPSPELLWQLLPGGTLSL
jgi:hypothetical protein